MLNLQPVNLELTSEEADVILFAGDDSHEWWWLLGGGVTISYVLTVSYSPDDAPQTAVHTMGVNPAKEQLKRLLDGGWEVVKLSDDAKARFGPLREEDEGGTQEE